MTFSLIIAAVIGYLLGSLPFGFLVAKAHGVDIFAAGSGNPGATNVKRVLGSRAGNLVYFLDALKGAAATVWPWVWEKSRGPHLGVIFEHGGLRAMAAIDVALPFCLAGLIGAVLGHTFSVFTAFRGGKGVATASGGLVVLMPGPILIGAVVWLVTFLLSRYVSLASILAAVVVPSSAWLLGLHPALKIVVTALGGLVILRHQTNIGRLIAGKEHRWERKGPDAGVT